MVSKPTYTINFNRRFDGLSLEIFTPGLGINRHRLQPSTSSSAFLSVTILVAGSRERVRLRCRRSTRTPPTSELLILSLRHFDFESAISLVQRDLFCFSTL